MKKNISYIVTISLCCLLLTGYACKKTRPQLPSNKKEKQNSQTELEDINKKLVEREDSIIRQYIENQKEKFIYNENGFWYKINRTTSERLLQKEDIIIFSYKSYLLDGTLIEEENDVRITIGKHEFMRGLDEGLLLMKKGEEATFIFPWTLAYGILGNGTTVPPYSSIILDIIIKEN